MIVHLGRRSGIALVAAAALAAASFALMFEVEISREYVEARLVELSWGEGEGQIPVRISRDGTAFGLRCFCTDRTGAVYAADWERGRVLKFDTAGQLVATIDVGRRSVGADDMAVSPSGDILLADNSAPEVLRIPWESAPVVIWSGKSGTRDISTVEWVRAGDQGTVYISIAALGEDGLHRRLIRVGERGNQETVASFTVTPSGESSWTGFTGRPDGPAVCFQLSRRGGFFVGQEVIASPTGNVRRYGWDGKPRAEYRVDVRTTPAVVSLLGDDLAGRLYVGLDLGTGRGEVVVCDGGDAPAARIPAPFASKVRCSVYARVDADGTVHLADAGVHGAAIRSLVPRRRMLIAKR
ncbi:MAG: hypothetical protein NUV93_08605 [Firmicutes bacterium]|jgi:sugar lactone lactonase YvrE|nr:hypothetical protein [Bacillota bacterium]